MGFRDSEQLTKRLRNALIAVHGDKDHLRLDDYVEAVAKIHETEVAGLRAECSSLRAEVERLKEHEETQRSTLSLLARVIEKQDVALSSSGVEVNSPDYSFPSDDPRVLSLQATFGRCMRAHDRLAQENLSLRAERDAALALAARQGEALKEALSGFEGQSNPRGYMATIFTAVTADSAAAAGWLRKRERMVVLEALKRVRVKAREGARRSTLADLGAETVCAVDDALAALDKEGS